MSKKDEEKISPKVMSALVSFFNVLNNTQKESITDKQAKDLIKKIQEVTAENYNDLSFEGQEAHHAYHSDRVISHLKNNGLFNVMTPTHTIVTPKGNVCIVKQPIGRVLGSVMIELQKAAIGKDPDLYAAGEKIMSDCVVYMDKEVKEDPVEMASVTFASVQATEVMMSYVKKN